MGFARSCAERLVGADVRTALAERLPWASGSFDGLLSQLVVSFLIDADAGVAEMRRVARRGGVVAACTWDYGVETTQLLVAVDYADYEDLWQPFLTGTGPAGAYCVSLDDSHRSALRNAVFQRLGAPAGSFGLTARAWAVRGTV